MPAKNLKRINEEATYSHIYNGGVEGRAIFESDADYQVFVGFLKEYLTPQDPKTIKKDFKIDGKTFQGTPHLPKNYLNDIELVAYSLTADRFNLILHQKTAGSIERFLRSLCTRYSMYFNKKYHRSGALFEGPYKSVQLKDEHELSNLTGFLHHSSNNSSYPEYLGSRKTSWVKPQVVLSLFKNGASDYKNLVEKERGKSDQLERSPDRRDLASSYDLRTDPGLKIRSRMREFLTISTLGFVVLVAISVRNITISKALSYQPQPTPAVLSETQEATTSEVSPEATLEATATAEMSTAPADAVKPEATPITSLTVKIADGSSFVNIRQKPTVNSEKIGKANDGDAFEFISINAGWYEIKLIDGSTGFISGKYAIEEEN